MTTLHSWHTLLDNALSQGRFRLFFQPVVSSSDTRQVLHYKVLSRLLDNQDQTIAAGHFLPWLERFGSDCAARPGNARSSDQTLGPAQPIGRAEPVGAATLNDPQALEHMFERLSQHPLLGERLTLEIGEEQVPEQAQLERLIRRMRGLGYSLGLQRFGGRFSMIGNLAHLGLAYLKIDGSYIRDIDQESHKRFFIRGHPASGPQH